MKDTLHTNIIEYKKVRSKKTAGMLVIGIILLLVSLISIMIGSYHLTFIETVKAILKVSLNPNHELLIWQMRLPRTITAIIAGAGLSVSGTIMQVCLKNDLASPSTLGITSAATFGANLSIIVFGSSFISNTLGWHIPFLTSLFAFIFSVLVVLLILTLSRYKSFTPASVILSGVAMTSLFQAFTTIIQYFADQVSLSQAIFWAFGDVSRAGWAEILVLFLIFIPIFGYFYKKSWDYNSLSAGDDLASSLGVHVRKTRSLSILLSALITSVCVSFLGMISFIGLLGPHIARKIFGKDHQLLIPASAMIGSIILLAADLISRTIVQPIVLPVGAITSFIGASMFLYILIKGKKQTCY